MLWAAAATAQAPAAQAPAEQAAARMPDRLVFSVDVAEDLTRFVPTFVKPTDTQPERGAFFVTEGKIFRWTPSRVTVRHSIPTARATSAFGSAEARTSSLGRIYPPLRSG